MTYHSHTTYVHVFADVIVFNFTLCDIFFHFCFCHKLHDRYSEDRLFVDIMRSVINSDLTVPELLNNQSNAEFYYHQVCVIFFYV